MNSIGAMKVMAALSQPTRMAAFERLVSVLPEGMSSSDIAAAVHCSPTSMSAHLAVMAHAGLVYSERRGRLAVYTALTSPLQDLRRYLALADPSTRSEAA